jgi:hypothetical protein
MGFRLLAARRRWWTVPSALFIELQYSYKMEYYEEANLPEVMRSCVWAKGSQKAAAKIRMKTLKTAGANGSEVWRNFFFFENGTRMVAIYREQNLAPY